MQISEQTKSKCLFLARYEDKAVELVSFLVWQSLEIKGWKWAAPSNTGLHCLLSALCALDTD